MGSAPELQEIVRQANQLISDGKDAMEALGIIAGQLGVSQSALYQRIRFNGGRLQKQFVIPQDGD